MSDYGDLIERLRELWHNEDLNLEIHYEAANALEAQAEVIFKLEKAYQEAREELTAAYMCGYERAKSEYAADEELNGK